MNFASVSKRNVGSSIPGSKTRTAAPQIIVDSVSASHISKVHMFQQYLQEYVDASHGAGPACSFSLEVCLLVFTK